MLTPPKIIDALKLVFWLKIFNVFYRKKVETEILKGTIIMSLRQKQTNDAGLSGLSLGVSAPKIKAETPPNIVFMMSDDIGYNDLAAYGQSYFPTPHTDLLAEQGIRLTTAYSSSAVCTPTRYAVLTGTDPFRRFLNSHVIFNAHPLLIEPGEPTVASLLKKVGYATGVIGKWHLGLGDTLPRDINHPGRGPNELGFDYACLVPDGHNMFPLYYIENGAVVGGVEPPLKSDLIIQNRVGTKLLQHKQQGEWPNRRPTELIGAELADHVDGFLEAHAEEPFFLYYPTCSIHFPLISDPRFQGQSGIGPHGDFVMEFDWAVGRVMAKLDELGLADNTLLIVTSDNGGYPANGHANSLIDHPHDPVSSFRGNKGDARAARWRLAPPVCGHRHARHEVCFSATGRLEVDCRYPWRCS
ncbi:MAG: sulfatase-like hydrolase/transferase [Lentisphaerae bacterium]|nr:sulfatase-like hydrolase/transferase [Lentisphaerota bacterium]